MKKRLPRVILDTGVIYVRLEHRAELRTYQIGPSMPPLSREIQDYLMNRTRGVTNHLRTVESLVCQTFRNMGWVW